MGLDALLGICGQPLIHQFLLNVVEHDGGPRFRHGAGDGEADSVGRAGDQRYFTSQTKLDHVVCTSIILSPQGQGVKINYFTAFSALTAAIFACTSTIFSLSSG